MLCLKQPNSETNKSLLIHILTILSVNSCLYIKSKDTPQRAWGEPQAITKPQNTNYSKHDREDYTINDELKPSTHQPQDTHQPPSTEGNAEIPTTTALPAEIAQVDLSRLTEKETAYVLLRREGLNHKDTCKALDITVGSGYTLCNRVKKKSGVSVRNLGLRDSKFVKAAHKAVYDLTRGKLVGEMKSITGSTVIAASDKILERAEPVIKRQINLQVKADISPVNLDKYAGSLGEIPQPKMPIIDITEENQLLTEDPAWPINAR